MELFVEYIFDGTENILFLEEVFLKNEFTQFDLKTFFHIPDFSSAFNGSIKLEIEKNLTFEPGFYLFFGKNEKYFSPGRGENNNALYFKLLYESK